MRHLIAAMLGLPLCLLGASALGQTPALDDPRPNGILSARERSLCEPPERYPDWCEQPHEVRAFLDRYDLCEHWRGEPGPEGDSAEDRARRREIAAGARDACAGNDRRLAELRRRYRNAPANLRKSRRVSETMDFPCER